MVTEIYSDFDRVGGCVAKIDVGRAIATASDSPPLAVLFNRASDENVEGCCFKINTSEELQDGKEEPMIWKKRFCSFVSKHM